MLEAVPNSIAMGNSQESIKSTCSYVTEYLGKSIEDCYVFGDSENDRAMLEAVPNSIAMGNSQESIKSTCSYVTADIEEDGIYKAMKHFGLI